MSCAAGLLLLTEAGRALLAEATPVWEGQHAAIERRLAASGADRLRAGLRSLS